MQEQSYSGTAELVYVLRKLKLRCNTADILVEIKSHKRKVLIHGNLKSQFKMAFTSQEKQLGTSY